MEHHLRDGRSGDSEFRLDTHIIYNRILYIIRTLLKEIDGFLREISLKIAKFPWFINNRTRIIPAFYKTCVTDLFSMSLNELQLTLHSRTSGWAAGRDLDAHLKRSRVSRLGTPSLKPWTMTSASPIQSLIEGSGRGVRPIKLGISIVFVASFVLQSPCHFWPKTYYKFKSSRRITFGLWAVATPQATWGDYKQD